MSRGKGRRRAGPAAAAASAVLVCFGVLLLCGGLMRPPLRG